MPSTCQFIDDSRSTEAHDALDYSTDDDYQIMEDFEDEEIYKLPSTEVHLNNKDAPMTEILDNFEKYVEHAEHHHIEFNKKQQVAIELLVRLRKSKACLSMYETIMEWHFRAAGRLNEHQKLSDCTDYISRNKLFKMLRKRYNLSEEDYINITPTRLPHCNARVKVVWNDAKACIQSLLTDPRIQSKDYLFHGNDPFGKPPERTKIIKDLNTGLAHTETHKKLIKKPNQILLPVIFYIDGANTGQFSDLPITAVKMTLGIFTKEARMQDRFWRILGCIPSYSKNRSRGRNIFHKSKHVDSIMAHQDALEDEGEAVNKEVSHAQDLHHVLSIVLKSYVEVQNRGFMWDFQHNGVVCPGVEFVLFTPFLKLDTDEAEKLCGKYTSRTGNVKCLCRYCECPTEETDDPLADYPMKTMTKIMKLIKDHDLC